MKGKGERSRLNNCRLSLLPWELIGEILSNLPLKSLLRFSAVSKSWNSMILDDPVFARKHKNRAALLPRSHRLVLCMHEFGEAPVAFFYLAPISSDLRMRVIKEEEEDESGDESSDESNSSRESDPSFSVFSNAKNKNDDVIRDLGGQFKGKPYLLAYCDELLCVQVKYSLFLWNPSMRYIVRLPPPSSLRHPDYILYGLAYDSVNDDYKILSLQRDRPYRSELYSLKHDCWREIKPFSSDVGPSLQQRRCEFVGGRFHWVALPTATAGAPPIIASFDLSTEKYGEVALPPEYDYDEDELEVVTLNGKLCAYVNYVDYGEDETQFVLWEYGVENSWTKRFDIMLSQPSILPGCSHPDRLRPLFLSDNNDLVVKIRGCCANDNICILMYRNGEAIRPKIIVKYENWSYCDVDAFLYVESLITHNNFSKDR